MEPISTPKALALPVELSKAGLMISAF